MLARIALNACNQSFFFGGGGGGGGERWKGEGVEGGGGEG